MRQSHSWNKHLRYIKHHFHDYVNVHIVKQSHPVWTHLDKNFYSKDTASHGFTRCDVEGMQQDQSHGWTTWEKDSVPSHHPESPGLPLRPAVTHLVSISATVMMICATCTRRDFFCISGRLWNRKIITCMCSTFTSATGQWENILKKN